ncbi:MAG: hypothetical protein ABI600_11840 [Luteolibacter sp.]
MSTTAKKKSVRGVRYTDAQKKEVVNFVTTFNAANGRGGQSKAAAKFGVSPLTVRAWLKGSGASQAGKNVKAAKAPKAPKAAKVAKASKAPKAPKATKAKVKAKGKGTVGTRYTPAEKQEVVGFVASYNSANGRGGQSKAAAKFGVSPLTVMAWLKNSGAPKAGKKVKAVKAVKASKAPVAAKNAGYETKLKSLVELNRQIEKSEAGIASLKAKFSKLLGSL